MAIRVLGALFPDFHCTKGDGWSMVPTIMALRKLSLIFAFSAAVSCGAIAEAKPVYAQSPVTVQDTVSSEEKLRLEVLADLRQNIVGDPVQDCTQYEYHDDQRSVAGAEERPPRFHLVGRCRRLHCQCTTIHTILSASHSLVRPR